MTFIYNINILICLLIFSIDVINANIAQKRTLRTEDNNMVDVTKGLSDAEIELALSDLTLYDLDMLSKFVDASGITEYDYQEDGYPINDFEGQQTFNDGIDDADTNADFNRVEQEEDDDQYYEKSPAPIGRRIADFEMPYADSNELEGESLRSKRENPQQREQISVDEEYIKQLENSFPRDQDQNNQDGMDVKKDHVRVKRD